jgi:predicted dehydrogenase
MPSEPMGVAFVGCGNISGAYSGSLASRPDLVRIVGAYDVDEGAAARFAEANGCRAYAGLNALLDDAAVGLVVNLTPQHVHAEVTSRSLAAGRHVHSEKPLALTIKEAVALVEQADDAGLRLSCAPFTWMGEAPQTAWKALRDGLLGTVRVAYAEMNWARIETWHPAPEPFYRAGVGPLADVGVYPLTLLTALLGPVVRVTGFGGTVLPERVTKDGRPFRSEAPDTIVGGLEFACGVLGRVTASFYVGPTSQEGVELHGDAGSIHLASSVDFAGAVRYSPYPKEGDWQLLPLVREGHPGVEWGRAVFDVVEAIREGRPHRASAAQAAHITEICCGITDSAQWDRPIRLHTTFEPPEPMDWAL